MGPWAPLFWLNGLDVALNKVALRGWFSKKEHLIKVLPNIADARVEPLFPSAPKQQWSLIENLSDTDLDILQFIHAGFDRTLVPFPDVSGAQWFGPDGEPVTPELLAQSMPEILGYHGRIDKDTLRARMPSILGRAWAQIIARGQTDGLNLSDMQRSDVIEAAQRMPYSNFFAIEEFDIKTRRFDGSFGPQVERAVLVATDAVLVLPYDPVRDRVLIVEQVRIGAWGRGDLCPWQLEPIAGRIDGGESPEQAARREALEETGLTLQSLKLIGQAYPTPGTSTEYYFMYVAIMDLPDDVTGVHGLHSEAENIRSHLVDFAQLDKYAEALQLSNLALLNMTHWLGRNREALRA